MSANFVADYEAWCNSLQRGYKMDDLNVWKAAIASVQPEIDGLKATLKIADEAYTYADENLTTAMNKIGILQEENAALRAESDGWQNRYDLKCVEFDKMQEYYEIREDMQFATTEENAALRARAEKAESELKAAREQKPDAWEYSQRVTKDGYDDLWVSAISFYEKPVLSDRIKCIKPLFYAAPLPQPYRKDGFCAQMCL